MMVARSGNTLKTTDLYSLNGWTAWHENYISIKPGKGRGGGEGEEEEEGENRQREGEEGEGGGVLAAAAFRALSLLCRLQV